MASRTDALVDVAVKPAPLSQEQCRWLDAALALIDAERMRTFNRAITAIHSPTGEERAINEWLTRHMQEMELKAFYQPVDERSGNAVGRLPGHGGGPSLMLYAPSDTHLRADPNEDVPWVGPELRPDMLPNASIADNGYVIGLAAVAPHLSRAQYLGTLRSTGCYCGHSGWLAPQAGLFVSGNGGLHRHAVQSPHAPGCGESPICRGYTGDLCQASGTHARLGDVCR